jgi:hypothetical protein
LSPSLVSQLIESTIFFETWYRYMFTFDFCILLKKIDFEAKNQYKTIFCFDFQKKTRVDS